MKQTEYEDEECIQCLNKTLIRNKSQKHLTNYEDMIYLECKTCGRGQMRFKENKK